MNATKSLQDLQDLGAAAREHLMGASDARAQACRPMLVPAGALRRAAAGAIDAFLVLTLTCLTAFVPLSDFDGHPRQGAIGDWALLTWLAAVALAYTAVEALGRPTVGKLCFGLRLRPAAAEDAAGWRRRTLARWLMKALPLMVCGLMFAAGLAHTLACDYEQFMVYGWDPGHGLLLGLLPLALLLAAFLPCAREPSHQSLYDRLSGVVVVRPEWVLRQRGFDVLPSPVLPALPLTDRGPIAHRQEAVMTPPPAGS